MPTNLTSDDLLLQPVDRDLAARSLKDWGFLLSGRSEPIAMSKFGDWFLRRPDGSTDELSVIEGTLTKIATSPDDFANLVNRQDWQEEHLLSLQVYDLHEIGVIPADGQCYGFAPHPILAGTIDIDQAMIFPIPAWQTICAQTFAPKN
ncbi:MAG: hypothetical protein ACPGVU_07000 [Limisphaerales bacterium]